MKWKKLLFITTCIFTSSCNQQKIDICHDFSATDTLVTLGTLPKNFKASASSFDIYAEPLHPIRNINDLILIERDAEKNISIGKFDQAISQYASILNCRFGKNYDSINSYYSHGWQHVPADMEFITISSYQRTICLRLAVYALANKDYILTDKFLSLLDTFEIYTDCGNAKRNDTERINYIHAYSLQGRNMHNSVISFLLNNYNDFGRFQILGRSLRTAYSKMDIYDSIQNAINQIHFTEEIKGIRFAKTRFFGKTIRLSHYSDSTLDVPKAKLLLSNLKVVRLFLCE